MGFGSLLGNASLKENLRSALSRGRASHFYLISGPEGSGKGLLARHLAAALLCREADAPCLRCNSCRKVLAGVHPDVTWVTDGEHKNVAVKIVRQVRDDVYIRPNEGSHKIYIFPQNLGPEGQNALLKVLEEPPAYGVFLLLADRPEAILPTVRSRCVELRLLPLSRDVLAGALQAAFPNAGQEAVDSAIERSGGYLGQAKKLLAEGEKISPHTEAFVQAIGQRDALLLTRTLVQMERLNRDQLLQILQQWLQIMEGAMACRAGMPAQSAAVTKVAATKSAAELLQAVQALQKALEYTRNNVSPGAVCGYLVHSL